MSGDPGKVMTFVRNFCPSPLSKRRTANSGLVPFLRTRAISADRAADVVANLGTLPLPVRSRLGRAIDGQDTGTYFHSRAQRTDLPLGKSIPRYAYLHLRRVP